MNERTLLYNVVNTLLNNVETSVFVHYMLLALHHHKVLYFMSCGILSRCVTFLMTLLMTIFCLMSVGCHLELHVAITFLPTLPFLTN
jgi:hypothetical protein